MAKRMLADVLWEAANEKLSPSYWRCPTHQDMYSCNAFALALGVFHLEQNKAARKFVVSLGCDPERSQELAHLCEYENGTEHLQGVRYMWLLLAMHVAEDEGIEIEVGA
jgi:hypothetical protein